MSLSGAKSHFLVDILVDFLLGEVGDAGLNMLSVRCN